MPSLLIAIALLPDKSAAQEPVNWAAPTESPRKVGLILAAERMHPAGANSLLKILEEPPPRVVFLLVSAAPERLLPTVLSRCQRLALGVLGEGDLRRALMDEDVVGERLELAMRMGAGSLERAREVAAGDYDETRRLCLLYTSDAADE